jgi:hypothetical protein
MLINTDCAALVSCIYEACKILQGSSETCIYYFEEIFLFCSCLRPGIMRSKYLMCPYFALIRLIHIL